MFQVLTLFFQKPIFFFAKSEERKQNLFSGLDEEEHTFVQLIQMQVLFLFFSCFYSS